MTAIAVVGTGVAYTVADMVDRVIATSGTTGCTDSRMRSTIALQMQPGMKRIGAQVGFSALWYGAAYMAGQKHPYLMAAAGGLGAGYLIHAIYDVLGRRALPALLYGSKTATESKDSLAARLYPADFPEEQKMMAAILDTTCTKRENMLRTLSAGV
jgi:hypothetical protein